MTFLVSDAYQYYVRVLSIYCLVSCGRIAGYLLAVDVRYLFHIELITQVYRFIHKRSKQQQTIMHKQTQRATKYESAATIQFVPQ